MSLGEQGELAFQIGLVVEAELLAAGEDGGLGGGVFAEGVEGDGEFARGGVDEDADGA